MHAKHVVYTRTLIRALQAGIKNTNPLMKNLSWLLIKNPRPFYAGFYCTAQLGIFAMIYFCEELPGNLSFQH